MTVLHSGSTKKFADGWDSIFTGGKRKKATAKKAKPAAKAAGKASAKKKPAAKKATKKR